MSFIASFLIAFFFFGNLTQVVICIGSDGHVALEKAHFGKCEHSSDSSLNQKHYAETYGSVPGYFTQDGCNHIALTLKGITKKTTVSYRQKNVLKITVVADSINTNHSDCLVTDFSQILKVTTIASVLPDFLNNKVLLI